MASEFVKQLTNLQAVVRSALHTEITAWFTARSSAFRVAVLRPSLPFPDLALAVPDAPSHTLFAARRAPQTRASPDSGMKILDALSLFKPAVPGTDAAVMKHHQRDAEDALMKILLTPPGLARGPARSLARAPEVSLPLSTMPAPRPWRGADALSFSRSPASAQGQPVRRLAAECLAQLFVHGNTIAVFARVSELQAARALRPPPRAPSRPRSPPLLPAVCISHGLTRES